MYRLEINALPPSLNQFYAGVHWSKRKDWMAIWHGLWRAALQEAHVPRPLNAPVTLSVTEYCKSHLRDCDNAVIAAKGLGDALVQYGYLPDDGPEFISCVILKSCKGESNKTVALIE